MDPEQGTGRRFTSQPEILPPGIDPIPAPAPPEPRGWYPPPQPVARPRRHWASAPATYTLVGINCAVYLMTLVLSHSAAGPTFEDNFSYGLLCNGGFVLGGEWWRLVTSIFVHFSW